MHKRARRAFYPYLWTPARQLHSSPWILSAFVWTNLFRMSFRFSFIVAQLGFFPHLYVIILTDLPTIFRSLVKPKVQKKNF